MGRHRLRATLPAAASVLLLSVFTACGSDDSEPATADTPQAKAAIAQYRSYMGENADELVDRVTELLAKIEAGDLPEAQSLYAQARVPYGQVDPFVRSVGNRAARIDPRADEVPPGELGGFHGIERSFWVGESTDGTAAMTRQLLGEVKGLQRQVRSADLQPVQIVRGANEVLDEIFAAAILGKEQPQAHIDMVDISANVEGVEVAFKAVRPLIADEDPELVASIERAFAEAFN